MGRGFKTCAASMLAGLAAAFVSNAAVAEPMFRLGQEIPRALVRACATAERATKEANLAWQQARDGAPQPAENYSRDRNQECGTVFAVIQPLRFENSIKPFIAWSITHDPSSAKSLEFQSKRERIPVSFQRQTVRYYYGRMKDDNGEWYLGWVELPDQPYTLKYLEHRQRAR